MSTELAHRIEAELQRLEPIRAALRQRSMLYQPDLKERVAAHYGLQFAEVDLPYPEWAALRERYFQETK